MSEGADVHREMSVYRGWVAQGLQWRDLALLGQSNDALNEGLIIKQKQTQWSNIMGLTVACITGVYVGIEFYSAG